jgi:methyl coenzyme M reductase system subunit A2
MLKVNNLVKDYVIDSDTVRVLKGINFDIKEGEILGIIGRSGGGKSTILKVLRGMEPFSEGNFELDGFKIEPGASHQDCVDFMQRNVDLKFSRKKIHLTTMNYMIRVWNF